MWKVVLLFKSISSSVVLVDVMLVQLLPLRPRLKMQILLSGYNTFLCTLVQRISWYIKTISTS